MRRKKKNVPLALAMLEVVYFQSITGFPSFVRMPLSSIEVPGPALAVMRASFEIGTAVYGH